MTTKAEFGKFMALLARGVPKFAPVVDDVLVELWFSELCMVPRDKLTEVLQRAMRTCDQFPSLRQVMELAGSGGKDEDKARDVAERIFTALCRGWASSMSKETQVKRDQFVGAVGIEVVRLQGGWQQLSNMVDDDNAGTHKAQWRELAAVLVRKSASGTLDQAPSFGALPPNVQSVIDAHVKQLNPVAPIAHPPRKGDA